MELPTYVTLTRQSGLKNEIRVIANNIANSATNGYRQEGLMFSEYVRNTDAPDTVSMATARVRMTSMIQGTLAQTGGPTDLAIEGDGFFLIETPRGERLTRAGAFRPNGVGDLITPEGWPVLDAGGAPIFVPPDAVDLSISADGTLSSNGQPIGQVGLVMPADLKDLVREDGVMFRAENGFEPMDNPRVLQGFLEQSNVDPITQVARMVEVQRAYEMGQSFLDAEDERIRNALKTIIK